MHIFLYDEFSPEDTAMMQALYSRSAQSVTEHAKKVRETGSGKFMERYYVNYGHSSIADCGSTTIFIEGISILADKAIQDWPLYSGQETSTRYINMAAQPLIDPIGTPESKNILASWMDFYTANQENVQKHLVEKYPRREGEDENIYNKAIAARAFDILRGFLPAGITTQLSWHTNLRQAWDKLALMRHHPLPEVREIAETILNQLKEKYPHSFSHQENDEQKNYREFLNRRYNYYTSNINHPDFTCATEIKNKTLEKYSDIMGARPPRANLPHFLTELGMINFEFLLDFGSFRDIQRHRNGVCRMPLLTTDYEFNRWYLEQLPTAAREKALILIEEQKSAIKNLVVALEIKQYYIALGFNMPCRNSYALPGTVYLIELRAGKTVHPTLRKIAHKMHHALKEKFPCLTLHSDLSLDDWDIRRGKQDILKK